MNVLQKVTDIGAKVGLVKHEDYLAENLALLAELDMELAAMQAIRKSTIDGLIPAEIAMEIEDVQAEFAPKETAAQEKIALLKEKMQHVALQYGKSYAGAGMTAVYMKGETVDKKRLQGLALMVPEVKQCFYYKPRVQFRRNNQGDF